MGQHRVHFLFCKMFEDVQDGNSIEMTKLLNLISEQVGSLELDIREVPFNGNGLYSGERTCLDIDTHNTFERWNTFGNDKWQKTEGASRIKQICPCL